MIFTNSRYVGATLVQVTSGAGTFATVYRSPPFGSGSFLHYQWVDGDSLGVLAYRFFADATQWWRIADANPEWFYPAGITPGSVIRIPQ